MIMKFTVNFEISSEEIVKILELAGVDVKEIADQIVGEEIIGDEVGEDAEFAPVE